MVISMRKEILQVAIARRATRIPVEHSLPAWLVSQPHTSSRQQLLLPRDVALDIARCERGALHPNP